MSKSIIAFLFAISLGVWLYNRLMRTTGGNTKNSVIGAAVSGVLIFVVMYFLAEYIDGLVS